MDKRATSSSGCAKQPRAGSVIRVRSRPHPALSWLRYTLVDILVNSFGLIVLSLRTIRRKTRFADEKRYRTNAPKHKDKNLPTKAALFRNIRRAISQIEVCGCSQMKSSPHLRF